MVVVAIIAVVVVAVARMMLERIIMVDGGGGDGIDGINAAIMIFTTDKYNICYNCIAMHIMLSYFQARSPHVR